MCEIDTTCPNSCRDLSMHDALTAAMRDGNASPVYTRWLSTRAQPGWVKRALETGAFQLRTGVHNCDSECDHSEPTYAAPDPYALALATRAANANLTVDEQRAAFEAQSKRDRLAELAAEYRQPDPKPLRPLRPLTAAERAPDPYAADIKKMQQQKK